MIPNSILVFVIESGICLVSFYLFYWFFLRKETFYKLNRVYLISAVVISIVIPLIHLHLPVRDSEAELITSISSFSQSIIPVELFESNPTVTSLSNQGNWLVIVLVGYFFGTAILIVRMIMGIVKILRIKREGIADHFEDYTIIYTKRNVSPFSFFHYVFLGESLRKCQTKGSILDHEFVHIKQLHTYDNLFIEFALAVFWFNPILWFYKEAIKSTHEYLADDGAILKGNNQFEYKSFMLEQILANPELTVSNSFASRIRKRVVMINRGPSTTAARGKLLLVIPLIFTLTVLFAGQDVITADESQYPPIVYDKDSIPVFYMGQHVYSLEGEVPATFMGGLIQDTFKKYVSQQLSESKVKAKGTPWIGDSEVHCRLHG